jgi:hypothetical protein
MPHHPLTLCIPLGLLLTCGAVSAQERYFLLSMGNSTYLGNAQTDADAAQAAAGLTGISSTMGTRGTGYKAMLGYSLSPTIAVEGGVIDLGSLIKYQSTSSGGTLNLDNRGMGLNLSALAMSPINSELSVFAKLGGTYSRSVTSASGSASTNVTLNEEKTSLGYGIGGLYNLTNKLGLRLEWERLYADVTLFSVGLQAKF